MDERTGFLIKRAEQALMAEKVAALRPFGLTVPQYAALLVLADEPGLSSAELARRCLVTAQNMGVVARNLQAKGLVERRPHPVHQPVIETHLTSSGRRLLRRADAAALAVELRLDTALDGQLTAFRRLLLTAAEALQSRAAPSDERVTA